MNSIWTYTEEDRKRAEMLRLEKLKMEGLNPDAKPFKPGSLQRSPPEALTKVVDSLQKN